MCKFVRFLTLLLVTILGYAELKASETTITFSGEEIVNNWILSEHGETENPLQWDRPTEQGLPIKSADAGYYPWIISSNQYNHVLKVEISVYSEYSRLAVNQIRVGNVNLNPQEEYGYDKNPEKTFAFISEKGSEPIGNIYLSFGDISTKTLYVKSIKITYDDDGASRELSWSVNDLTINLGESYDSPTLTGETSGVVYSSSNPNVARISSNGDLMPTGEGEAVITASCPAAYPWQAGECSYNLVVKLSLSGSGTSEIITLTSPGSLREEVMSLESVKIKSIKVNGPINSQDITYLRETTGRFSNLQAIDLSDATLIADNGQYATFRGENHDVGMGYDEYVFILSNENKIDRKTTSTGLGGGVATYTYYTDQLAGAFCGLTNLKQLVLPSELTMIAPFIAAECTSLVSVAPPVDYSSIGDYSFKGCAKLAHIISSPACTAVGKKAFFDSGLVSFDFAHIEMIAESSFRSTNLMENLDLKSVKEIESSAFYECRNLTSVSFGEDLTSIGSYAFRLTGICGALTIPSKCIAIGAEAFADTRITSISIPSGCIEIGAYPFNRTPWYNNAMQTAGADEVIYLDHIALAYKTSSAHSSDGWSMELYFRDGTTSIADNFGRYFADYGNDKITSLRLPSTLKRIGNNAFDYILSKTDELELPDGLESIGKDAFLHCGVGQLTLNSNIKQIGDKAFNGCNGLVRLNYNVPNAVGQWIFSSCSGLETIKFGSAVNCIPNMAFAYCQALTKFEFDGISNNGIIKVRNSVVEAPLSLTIGESAFANNINLSTITLPSYLKGIGTNAFNEVKLKTVYCYLGEPIDVAHSGIFSNGKATTIYVAKEIEDIFKDNVSWNQCNIVGTDEISGIEDIDIDNDRYVNVSVYNLEGVLIYEGALADANIPTGIYIVVTGQKIFKIKI